MPVESPINGIWSLDENNPLTTDSRRQGDDHLRLIKDAIKKTFPSVNAVVNATDEDLNLLAGLVAAGITQSELLYLDGLTGNIQNQIDDPTIVRTDQANTIDGGALALDEQLLNLIQDNATLAKVFLRLLDTLAAVQWQINVNAQSSGAQFQVVNNAAATKLQIAQDSLLLSLTNTNINWGGSPLALQSAVTALDSATAKNDDFNLHAETFVTTAGAYTGTIVTPYGDDDFIWGVMGARRDDDSSGFAVTNWKLNAAGGAGRTLQSFEGGVSLGFTGPTYPVFPVSGNGEIRYRFQGSEPDNRGWTLTFWSRNNI